MESVNHTADNQSKVPELRLRGGASEGRDLPPLPQDGI